MVVIARVRPTGGRVGMVLTPVAWRGVVASRRGRGGDPVGCTRGKRAADLAETHRCRIRGSGHHEFFEAVDGAVVGAVENPGDTSPWNSHNRVEVTTGRHIHSAPPDRAGHTERISLPRFISTVDECPQREVPVTPPRHIHARGERLTRGPLERCPLPVYEQRAECSLHTKHPAERCFIAIIPPHP